MNENVMKMEIRVNNTKNVEPPAELGADVGIGVDVGIPPLHGGGSKSLYSGSLDTNSVVMLLDCP